MRFVSHLYIMKLSYVELPTHSSHAKVYTSRT